MSAPIKRFAPTCDCLSKAAWGDYVLHSDHIASHAFDEAEERKLFEAWFTAETTFPPPLISARVFSKDIEWQAWLSCARSRAERFAGGVE